MKWVVIVTNDETNFSDIVFHNIDLLELNNVEYKLAINNAKNSMYEIFGIQIGMKEFDEFVLLQDSVELHNIDIIQEVFLYSDKSVFLSSWGQNYFGKYLSRILNKMELPLIKSKADSVYYEREFFKEYSNIEKPIIIHDGILENTNVFEYAYGRNNMIINNEYFKKYKWTWDIKQVVDK